MPVIDVQIDFVSRCMLSTMRIDLYPFLYTFVI